MALTAFGLVAGSALLDEHGGVRVAATGVALSPPRDGWEQTHMRPPAFPSPQGLRRAEHYARARDGLVSFAVVDSRGRVAGLAQDRGYVSASVVKAMLLAAELRRLDRAGAPVDEPTLALLTGMITYSDNDAADAIYARVGDAGLHDVARRAGMDSFTVSGYWGNAQITARDIARFMAALGELLPDGARRSGFSLLERVVPEQRWGIPEAAGRKWTLRFKGGWRSTELGELVHQAAALRHEDRTRIAIAVLTDAQPTQTYGRETVRGVAERLLGTHPGSSLPSHSE